MGTDLSRLSSLFTDVAKAEDFPGLVERDAPVGWAFAVSETSPIVEVAADESRGVIVLSAELGRFAGTDEGTFLPLALGYACAHDETGGLRLGRRPDGGDYVLYTDLGIEALRRDNLGTVMRGFADKAELWAALLAGTTQDAVPTATGDTFIIRA